MSPARIRAQRCSLIYPVTHGWDSDLYRVALGGGMPERLALISGLEVDWIPASPEGDTLAVSGSRWTGEGQIYTLRADGTGFAISAWGGPQHST